MTQSELVTADRLRPGDVLITTEGPLELRAVARGGKSVQLRTGFERGTYRGPSRWWAVPITCRFRRQIISRKIDMRPDLHAKQHPYFSQDGLGTTPATEGD